MIGAIGASLSIVWGHFFHKTGLEDPCDSTAGRLKYKWYRSTPVSFNRNYSYRAFWHSRSPINHLKAFPLSPLIYLLTITVVQLRLSLRFKTICNKNPLCNSSFIAHQIYNFVQVFPCKILLQKSKTQSIICCYYIN